MKLIHRIRYLTFLCGVLLLCTAPVYAQTPTPAPQAQVTNQLLSDLLSTVNSLGIFAFILIGIVVICLLIVGAVFLAQQRGLLPLLKLLQTSEDARGELRKELVNQVEARVQSEESRERSEQAYLKMSDVRLQALTDLTDSIRKGFAAAEQTQHQIVADINARIDQSETHVTATIEAQGERTMVTLTTLQEQINELATKAQLEAELEPIQKYLGELKQMVKEILDRPLTPADGEHLDSAAGGA